MEVVTPYRTYRPTTAILQATTRLERKLRAVTFPARGKTLVKRNVPPGRINMTQAIQAKAQVANGQMPTAKPFVSKLLAPVEHTPITAGIMFDSSASQGNVQEAVGVARYVLTSALARVGGRVAAVQFGTYGHPIQAPHQPLNEVEVYSAMDGWENYIEGFSLIDGALDLIDGEGARLLFIVTDGNFNSEDAAKYAEVTMDMCRQAGVAVVWLDCRNFFKRPDAFGHGEIVSVRDMSPTQVADLMGEAIIRQFRKVAPQHSMAA